ncbi:peptide deformylase [Arcanobacterium hippocoleae]|uniref:Peptide deformylase n=1 Tax=Arcanobacterium hippocoleae TaxID=149017 RepID=A0ABU1T0T0_9ACTO|nr:peptide deformylase [Arcanobacterium hippocoleae]MDR6938976.1 peptide deformylase [Arcanobacterium hippocoleae]
MAYREIRIIGDPILRTVCKPIMEITPGIRALVDDLMETVDEPGRAGLAANQIGQSWRAFSYNIDGKKGYILNPEIVDISTEEYQDGDEGCLSVPELWYPCERAWYAKCEGTDLDGNKVVLEGEEIWARLIQHETDHLDGHIYIDRLKRADRKKALREIRERGF